VKGHCAASESKEKFIEVVAPDASSYKPGDRVQVYGATSMGMKAVFYAFVIPFLVLILTLFGVSYLTDNNELLSISVSFLFLIIYYIILARNKHKLIKEFTFNIKSINNSNP